MPIPLSLKLSTSLDIVRKSGNPEDAWILMLKGFYKGRQLDNQIKHTCPKWAFCILCNRGLLKGIPAGCCPRSEDSESGKLAIIALEKLLADPALFMNKEGLTQAVYGSRSPNEEVSVVLTLLKASEFRS